MPKYAKPHKGTSHVRRFSHFTPVAAAVSSTSIENIAKASGRASCGAGGSTSGKEENSSEDELLLGHVQRHRGSISSGGKSGGKSYNFIEKDS